MSVNFDGAARANAGRAKSNDEAAAAAAASERNRDRDKRAIRIQLIFGRATILVDFVVDQFSLSRIKDRLPERLDRKCVADKPTRFAKTFDVSPIRALQPKRSVIAALALVVPLVVVLLIIFGTSSDSVNCGGGNPLANYFEAPHYASEVAGMQRLFATSQDYRNVNVKHVAGRQLVLVMRYPAALHGATDFYLFGGTTRQQYGPNTLRDMWQRVYLANHPGFRWNTPTSVVILLNPRDPSDEQSSAARFYPQACTPL